METGAEDDESDKEIDRKRLRDQDASVRIFAGELYEAAKSHKGGRTFLTRLIKEAGYEVTDRTLRRYRFEIEAGGTPLSDSKRTGATRSLSDAQMDVVVGFVLHKNRMNEPVSGKVIRTFCATAFGISVSKQTVSRYMSETGFTVRKSKLKAGGFTVDFDSLVDVYWDWLQQAREDGMFNCSLSNICSIDFTFTSHRTRHETSYSLRGG